MAVQLDFFNVLDTTPLNDNIVTPTSKGYEAFLNDWRSSKWYALDLETACSITSEHNGLDYRRGRIRLIQISLDNERVLIVDAFDYNPDNLPCFFNTLKDTLRDPNNLTVGMSISFDLSWLQQKYGFYCQGVRDIRVLSILCFSGIKTYSHGLKGIVQRLFNVTIGKEQQASNWANPGLANTQLNYAADDVIWTLRCYKKLCGILRHLNELPTYDGKNPHYSLIEIAKVECEVIPSFVDMQLRGIPVNIEYARQIYDQYMAVINEFSKEMEEVLGLPYSANSNKLALAVYYHLDILLLEDKKAAKADQDIDTKDVMEQWKQTSLFKEYDRPDIPKDKVVCTASHVLFAYYCKTDCELLLKISLARSLKKAADAVKSLYESAEDNNGRATGYFTSLGNTGTGRSTSKGGGKSTIVALNLQNIINTIDHPLLDKYNLPPVRSAIQAPIGNKMMVFDLASSHLRNAALLSEDHKIEVILNYDDPHSYLTSKLMQSRGIDVTREYCEKNKKKDPQVKEFRSLCKTFLR